MAEKPAPKQRTLYFTGEARTTSDNAITRIYGTFYLAFEVAAGTGEILDVDCNATLELTRKFVKTYLCTIFWKKIGLPGGRNTGPVLRFFQQGHPGRLPGCPGPLPPGPGKVKS